MSEPLLGKRVVVTRSRAQAPMFCQALEALGAEALGVPTIRFDLLPSDALDAALRQLRSYDWLLFTSANAVKFFFSRLDALGLGVSGPRIAASGPATAEQLLARGLTPDFVPAEYVGERLVEGLGDVAAQRLLLPRSRKGRPEIARMLADRGAHVDDIPLYDTVCAEPDPTILLELERGFDAVTFASPSSVRNFLKIIESWPAVQQQLSSAVVACIGPITADAAREQGLSVAVMPEAYTIEGLAQALAGHYASTENLES